MRINPEVLYYPKDGTSPLYQCRCGYTFARIDLLKNKPFKGTRDYCPLCKVKFVFGLTQK